MGLGNMMKREISNGLAQRPFARHRLGILGLALTLAPFAMIGEAQACTVGGVASASASNSIVDCTGLTANSAPSGTSGYGTNADINNTYNIQVGASVAGTIFGFTYNKGAIFNNSGAISGLAAINGGDATVHNLLAGATITGTATAIDAGLLTLDNAGTISATGAGSTGVAAAALNLTGNTG